MIFNTIALLSASALAAPAIQKRDDSDATSDTPANLVSGPFKLQVVSSNSTINGGTVSPVHAGAAIEALSVGGVGTDPSNWPDFYFNQSSYAGVQYPYGALFWNLTIGGGQVIPSGLKIPYGPSSSLVPTTLQPGAEADRSGTYFSLSFDDDGYLGLPDTNHTQRWYACQQVVGGYNYYSVAWSTDPRQPENPTCSPIQLQKIEPIAEDDDA